MRKGYGTPAVGTVMVKDINPRGPGESSPFELTKFGGTLSFSAFDPTNGSELWKTNGTAEGTILVADICEAGVA